jgi:hypothetical protein
LRSRQARSAHSDGANPSSSSCQLLARPAVTGWVTTIAPEWHPIGGRCIWGWTLTRACANDYGIEWSPVGRHTTSEEGETNGL